MGVVKRQGFKASIINYLGVILGFIGTLFIYPLDKETYGQIQIWIANGTLLVPFLTFGSNTLITKFYTKFKSKYKVGFGSFILKITIYSLILGTLLLLGTTLLHNLLPEKSHLNFFKLQNLRISYIIGIFILLISLFKLLSSIKLRIVIPELITNLGLKIFIISIIIIQYYYNAPYIYILITLLLFFIISLILLILYNYKLDNTLFRKFNLSLIDKEVKNEIKNFWIYTGLNIFGTILIYNIDVVMIGEYENSESVTNYLAFVMMANTITIPGRSFQTITAPLVSESMEKKEYNKIASYYSDLSKNLLIFGILCFGLLWININEILLLMKNGETYSPYKACLLFLGLSKLIELSTSINHQILTYSKWYRYNLVLLLIISLTNISLNYLLIQSYGIIGIAIGTAISILIYNILKTILVYVFLKIHPFSMKMLPSIFIVFVLLLLPEFTITSNFVVSGVLKSFLFLAGYIYIIFRSNSSYQFNNWVYKIWSKIKFK